ncbi:MAG: methionyl-tRNA formyltransferase [Kordiimonadaceae bacterium]|nr:methionyl-tRNA formyltransferase [Kordiimonadaceae bacterium]
MGQQAFGKDALETLLDAGTDEVVAVYCEPDKEGKPVDPIKEFALEKGLPVHQPANFNDQDTLTTLASFDADLMIMAFVNVFVPEAARDTPKMGSICFHPSLLPKYRGPSAVNWPIIMGDTTSGYSWFYPSDGLDEGDCLLQWECPLDPDDTVINLYFKKIYPSAVSSVLQVCELFRSGNPPRIVADESQASYERRCLKKHAHIDWHKPVAQVYNLIRGTNPSPGAWTTLNGVEVSIYNSQRVDGDGISGRIMDISEEGVTVQCIGGRILIQRVKPSEGAKQPASEWAEAINLKIKDNIGN